MFHNNTLVNIINIVCVNFAKEKNLGFHFSCIWQKLYVIWSGKGHSDETDGTHNGKSALTVVDYDDDGLPIMKLKAKPVIQFYFLAYGISFIICGINVAISRDQYITNKM